MLRCVIFALLTTCIAQDADYITAETEKMGVAKDVAVELLQRRSSVVEDIEVDDDVTVDMNASADFDSDDEFNLVESDNSAETCEAFENANPGLVKVDFAQAVTSINNLGGVGPQRGAAEQLFYKRAATAIGNGDEYDLKVTVRGSYRAANTRKNGKDGHFGTINLMCGRSVDLDFQFVDPKTGQAATLEHFFFSFFDIDQGVAGMASEEVVLWPGYSNVIVSSFSELTDGEVTCPAGAGAQMCRSFKSSTKGSAMDNPKNPLTLTKLQAARTFSIEYRQVSSFTVTLKTGRGGGGRLFAFTGLSQVALASVKECCAPHLCGCPSSCEKRARGGWAETCKNAECSKCDQCFTTTTTTTVAPTIQEEACKNGITFEMSSGSLVENTLGTKEDGRMLFKGVLQYEGRSVDLSVTDVATEPEYSDRGMMEYDADRRGYTGEYKGAGRVAFDKAGQYMLRFQVLDSDTGEETKLPLIPFVMYDVDGKGETITACGATGAITHEDTALKEREWPGCFQHTSRRKEANIPTDFDSLTIRQKKVAVTYVYRDTGAWDIGVSLPSNNNERYILFGGSKVLACNYEDKTGNKPWKKKGKAGDA